MFLFPRRKSNQKGAQGARPLENPQFVVYLPSAVAGLFLPKFLPFACRCPASTHRFYRGAKQRGECLRFCRAAIRRVPAADSVPLRGRQAELVESQATRSEPRRKRSFTGHRSSSLAERPRKAPVYFGGLGEHPQRLFGYFLCGQKVTAGRGGAKPPLVSRHSAFRRTTARAEQARG